MERVEKDKSMKRVFNVRVELNRNVKTNRRG